MTIMYEAIKSNLRAEQKCGRVHNWQVEKEIRDYSWKSGKSAKYMKSNLQSESTSSQVASKENKNN